MPRGPGGVAESRVAWGGGLESNNRFLAPQRHTSTDLIFSGRASILPIAGRDHGSKETARTNGQSESTDGLLLPGSNLVS